jgi:hypothetical protein
MRALIAPIERKLQIMKHKPLVTTSLKDGFQQSLQWLSDKINRALRRIDHHPSNIEKRKKTKYEDNTFGNG